MNLLRDLFYPPITLERFKAVREAEPKRICFGSTHRTALKRSAGGQSVGFLNVPFTESFDALFPWKLFKNTRGRFGGYYRAIRDEAENAEIKQWISDREQIVFIRSGVTTAVAACEHFRDADTRSATGELEHAAKYGGSHSAKAELAEILFRTVRLLYDQHRIDAIAAVPPTTPGTVGLPQYLAAALSDRMHLPNVTDAMKWDGTKPSKVGISIDRSAVQGKSILLVDDMYQSGTTVHFVASALRAAGANDIHVLAVSKGRRDTDNT